MSCPAVGSGQFMWASTTEIVSVFLAPVAIAGVIVFWTPSSFRMYLGQHYREEDLISGETHCLIGAFVLVVFATQRALQITAPPEYPAAEDTANLTVSLTAAAFAMLWVLQKVTNPEERASALDHMGDGSSKRCECCKQIWRRRFGTVAGSIGQLLAIAAWMLDVRRRNGVAVQAVGWTGVACALLAIWASFCYTSMPQSATRTGRMSANVVFLLAATACLTAVQLLRPCASY